MCRVGVEECYWWRATVSIADKSLVDVDSGDRWALEFYSRVHERACITGSASVPVGEQGYASASRHGPSVHENGCSSHKVLAEIAQHRSSLVLAASSCKCRAYGRCRVCPYDREHFIDYASRVHV